MPERYAILAENGGWLVNLVMWDGNTENWSTPAGTYAVKASEIDFKSLPPNPEITEI